MVRRLMERCVRRLTARFRPLTLMGKVARFVACEMVEGDYLEFGVYRGGSFVRAYRALEEQFRDRIRLSAGGEKEEEGRRRRRRIWDQMRFIAFDSFEGLPDLSDEDKGTSDFTKGMYACTQEEFESNLKRHEVPLERTVVIKGWFEETCTRETAARHGIERAAIVWIDGDLYSSAKIALRFISDLLQDGTVIIFDDWFSYKGNPRKGEQRAFYEWIQSPGIKEKFLFTEYHKEGWQTNSFIVSEKT